MKTKLKKFLSGLILSTVLMSALPSQKAEAGLIIAIDGGFNLATDNYSTNTNISMIVLGAGLIAGAIVFRAYKWSSYLFCLEQNQEQLNQLLWEKYPFIDNQEVLNNFSTKILSKAAEGKMTNQGLFVNFEENEISEMLSPLDLTAEQLQ